MVYAFLSLGFAGVNDILFKRYGRKTRSIGLLLAMAGTIWLFFFLALGFTRGCLALDATTLLAGSLAGASGAWANILLIEGMKGAGAAIGATIYRLNLVFVALLALPLLGESMGPLKLGGLSMAVLSVAVFSLGGGASGGTPWKFMAILLGASLLRAFMGISYKFAQIWGANDMGFLAVGGIWWIASGIAYAMACERGMAATPAVFGYGLLCGTLICGIVLFLKIAINAMDASIAVSVSQFSFLVTAPLSALFLGERLTTARGFGLGLAALCITLFYFAR